MRAVRAQQHAPAGELSAESCQQRAPGHRPPAAAACLPPACRPPPTCIVSLPPLTHCPLPPASRYACAQGDGRRCQIITGPNMGGKSCYTRCALAFLPPFSSCLAAPALSDAPPAFAAAWSTHKLLPRRCLSPARPLPLPAAPPLGGPKQAGGPHRHHGAAGVVRARRRLPPASARRRVHEDGRLGQPGPRPLHLCRGAGVRGLGCEQPGWRQPGRRPRECGARLLRVPGNLPPSSRSRPPRLLAAARRLPSWPPPRPPR